VTKTANYHDDEDSFKAANKGPEYFIVTCKFLTSRKANNLVENMTPKGMTYYM
jgi:hypothetical protein